MIMLFLVGAWALDLDVSAVYGYGERHAVGGAAELAAALPVWHTNAADGWLRGGAFIGYQAEPYSQSNGFLGGAVASGAGHRLEGWIFVEHRFRLLPSRRLHFGVGIFGGLTELFIRGRVVNDARGVDGRFDYDQAVFTMGLSVTIGVDVHERVTIIAKGMAPFPYASGAITSYVLATLGVSFTLAAF